MGHAHARDAGREIVREYGGMNRVFVCHLPPFVTVRPIIA